MSNEEDDEFDQFTQKLNQFMESLTTSQRENIPELMASITLLYFKEGNFEKALEMVR